MNADLSSMALGALATLFVVSLVALLVVLRRRRPPAPAPAPEPRPAPSVRSTRVAVTSSPRVRRGGGGGAALDAALAATATMGCPTCRRSYEGLVYCPRDARRLVPTAEVAVRGRGVICPACRRAFDAGIRTCPHDGAELMSALIFEAGKARRGTVPTGVVAKICPQCRKHYDLAASFCGKDGTSLLVVN